MLSKEEILFTTILDEANVHYTTGRYIDAAKTFEHLTSKCIKEKLFEDMLYFTYRAVGSWKKADEKQNMIKLYQKVGVFSLKLSTKKAFELSEKSINLIDKAKLYNIIQNNLKYLGQEEKRIEVIEELLLIYSTIIDKSEDYITKKDLIEKSIVLANILDKKTERTKLLYILCKLIEKEGDFQLKNAPSDAEEISIRLYTKAINLIESDENRKLFKRLQKKIDKLE